jgi:hypothetical protein
LGNIAAGLCILRPLGQAVLYANAQESPKNCGTNLSAPSSNAQKAKGYLGEQLAWFYGRILIL